MAAPELIQVAANIGATGTASGASSVASADLNLAETGDLLVWCSTGRGTVTAPPASGTGGQTWTQVTTGSSNPRTYSIFWAVFDGTWDSDPTNANSPGATTIQISVWRAENTGVTWSHELLTGPTGVSAPGSPFTCTVVGGTPSGSDPCVIVGYLQTADDNTWGSLSGSGWAMLGSSAGYANDAGSDNSLATCYLLQASPAAPGSPTINQATNGGDAYTRAMVAFKAAGGTPPGYTLTADGGAVTVTGTAASLLFGRHLDADAGAVVVTGTDATLTLGSAGYTLSANGGAVTITGGDATLIYDAGTQILVPTDVTDSFGTWTGTPDNTNLETNLDEETPSDTDYIYSDNAATGYIQFSLSAGTAPASNAGHKLVVRMAKILSGSVDTGGDDPLMGLTVTDTVSNNLISNISGGSVVIPVTGGWADYELILDETTLDGFGVNWDWADLKVDIALDDLGSYNRGVGVSSIQLRVAGAASGAYTLTATGGTVAVAGTAASLKLGRRLVAEGGAVAVTGTAATLRQGRTLAAGGGAVAVAGTAAGLLVGRLLGAGAGAVAVAGTAATLRLGRRLAAEGGAVTITGTAASLLFGRHLDADSGAVVVTGTAATLTYNPVGGFTLVAEGGAVVVTGTSASLEFGRLLAATGGSVAIAGTAAALLVGRRIVAESGAVAVAGADATLTYTPVGGFTLAAEGGTVTVAGTAATLTRRRAVIAESGAVVVTGTAATLRVTRRLTAESGAVTITGTDATLTYTPVGAFTLVAEGGAVAITGADATLRIARTVAANGGSVTITGGSVAFVLDRLLAANGGAVVVTGTAALLRYSAAKSTDYAVTRLSGPRTEVERQSGRVYETDPDSGPRYVIHRASGPRHDLERHSGARYRITREPT